MDWQFRRFRKAVRLVASRVRDSCGMIRNNRSDHGASLERERTYGGHASTGTFWPQLSLLPCSCIGNRVENLVRVGRLRRPTARQISGRAEGLAGSRCALLAHYRRRIAISDRNMFYLRLLVTARRSYDTNYTTRQRGFTQVGNTIQAVHGRLTFPLRD